MAAGRGQGPAVDQRSAELLGQRSARQGRGRPPAARRRRRPQARPRDHALGPARGAETRFETNGVKVTSGYTLTPNGGGTTLTQTMDAKASGLTARMLIPVVQGRLEKKLTQDLERLREVLGS